MTTLALSTFTYPIASAVSRLLSDWEALGPLTGAGAACTPGSYPAGPSVCACVSFRASSLPQMVECGEISIYQCLLESDLG